MARNWVQFQRGLSLVKVNAGGRPKSEAFTWVNTGLGNVKGAITGTLRSCDARHTPRYLAGFDIDLIAASTGPG